MFDPPKIGHLMTPDMPKNFYQHKLIWSTNLEKPLLEQTKGENSPKSFRPWKVGPKRKVVLKWSFFRGELFNFADVKEKTGPTLGLPPTQ